MRMADIKTQKRGDEMLIPVAWLFPTHSKVQKASRGVGNGP